MAYYNTCPNCGCNLDPGEKCDCEKEMKRQKEFYQRVTKITPKTRQMAFVLDGKEVGYAGKAIY